jgi:formylglycine-generating enzyme required for sulfatase activity
MYDMTGNMWEWVGDWYDKNYYAHSPTSNPLGPEIGYARVLRGGFWSGPVDMLRTSARSAYDPNNSPDMLGFRCARPSVKAESVNGSATPTPEVGSATQLPEAQTSAPLPNELTDAQGVSMRLVSAGPITMGSEIQPDEQPAQIITLGAFYMDVYEVTNARYKACVEAGVCTIWRKSSIARKRSALSPPGSSR